MKVEIKDYTDESTKETYRAIFVNDIVFDWGLDAHSLSEAKKFAKNDLYKKSIMGDIQKHFVESFSEFIGREVKLSDILAALESGEIE